VSSVVSAIPAGPAELSVVEEDLTPFKELLQGRRFILGVKDLEVNWHTMLVDHQMFYILGDRGPDPAPSQVLSLDVESYRALEV
jgi:hypothetical protein